MFDKSQLMRGTLEGCILKIINGEVTYGYEIMERLISFGFSDIREGTIYPLLLRLEKKNFISSEFRASPLGPNRKYYYITKDGIANLNSFEETWNDVSRAVIKIFGMREVNDKL